MNTLKGKIYLMLGFSLAGTSVITGYILSKSLKSFTITAVSLSILLLCLSPFYFGKTLKTVSILQKSDWKMLILQAVFGIFLFRVFLLLGVGLTTTAEAGILTGITPALTSLLAFFFLKERFSSMTALGIFCTVFGIIMLQGINLFSVKFSLDHFLGNMLIMCAAASESAFNVLSRKHKSSSDYTSFSIDPMVQTLLVSSIAFILSFPLALWEHPFSTLQMIGLKEWLTLAWYGLIVTALAFFLFYQGVKHCSAYTTAAFSGMIPLVSMLLTFFFLKEEIAYTQWIGGLLIISGMLLISKVPKKTIQISS